MPPPIVSLPKTATSSTEMPSPAAVSLPLARRGWVRLPYPLLAAVLAYATVMLGAGMFPAGRRPGHPPGRDSKLHLTSPHPEFTASGRSRTMARMVSARYPG